MLQKAHTREQDMKKADNYDLALTGSFLIGFVGNIAIQVLYILLWVGFIGNTTDWRCVVDRDSS